MARLEDLSTGTRLTGLAASGSATVESVQWIGEQALKVIYRDGDGQLSDRLLYRDDEPSLELVEMGRPWSFDGDLLRLVPGEPLGLQVVGAVLWVRPAHSLFRCPGRLRASPRCTRDSAPTRFSTSAGRTATVPSCP